MMLDNTIALSKMKEFSEITLNYKIIIIIIIINMPTTSIFLGVSKRVPRPDMTLTHMGSKVIELGYNPTHLFCGL